MAGKAAAGYVEEGVAATAASASSAASVTTHGSSAWSYFSGLTRRISELYSRFRGHQDVVKGTATSTAVIAPSIVAGAVTDYCSVTEIGPDGKNYSMQLFFREPTKTFTALQTNNFVSYFISAHGSIIPEGFTYPETFELRHPFPCAILQPGGAAIGCPMTQSVTQEFSALSTYHIPYMMSYMLFGEAQKYIPPIFHDMHFATSDTLTYRSDYGKLVVNYEKIPNRNLSFSNEERDRAKGVSDFARAAGRPLHTYTLTDADADYRTLLMGVYVYDPMQHEKGLVRDDRFDVYFGDGKTIDLKALITHIPLITGITRPSIFTLAACASILYKTTCKYDRTFDLHLSQSKYAIPRLPRIESIPDDVLPPTVLIKTYLAENGSTYNSTNLHLTSAALPNRRYTHANSLVHLHRFAANAFANNRLKNLREKYNIPLKRHTVGMGQKIPTIRFMSQRGSVGVGPTRKNRLKAKVYSRGFGPTRRNIVSNLPQIDKPNYYELRRAIKKRLSTVSENEKPAIMRNLRHVTRLYVNPKSLLKK